MDYHYKHLSIDEREIARGLFDLGLSLRFIASVLDRSPSTLSREIKRNSLCDGKYIANKAQHKYSLRKKCCGRKNIFEDVSKQNYVKKKIIEEAWTPEQICGRAKREGIELGYSYNTIYRAIHKGIIEKTIKKKMRYLWKYKKRKTNDKRGKIQETKSIHDRPESVEDRQEAGHWESDTVFGTRRTGCLATHVERKSGFLIARRLASNKADLFNKATIEAFKDLPSKIKKSFTVDNGIEFVYHKELEEKTGMNVYFCDPYSSWQRGTNENTNGLLRQFYPKETSFEHIDETLEHVVNLINNRPRKRLNWRTPYEVLQEILQD